MVGTRHGRACPGHPCLASGLPARKTWMPAFAGMTAEGSVGDAAAPFGDAPGDHLLEDAAADRRVRRRRIAPPPAVALHRAGGGDEAVGHGVEIRLAVVE